MADIQLHHHGNMTVGVGIQHIGAAAVDALDQSLLGQYAEGLAHGWQADSELFGQDAFGIQPVTRPPGLLNAPGQMLRHLLSHFIPLKNRLHARLQLIRKSHQLT